MGGRGRGRANSCLMRWIVNNRPPMSTCLQMRGRCRVSVSYDRCILLSWPFYVLSK